MRSLLFHSWAAVAAALLLLVPPDATAASVRRETRIGLTQEAQQQPASDDDDGGNLWMRTISVTGQGSVPVTPDMATVRTGVNLLRPTAALALSDNSELIAAMTDVLKDEFFIEDRDIQTTGFSFSTEMDYSYEREPGEQPSLLGYRVYNNLVVTIRDLTQVGAVLDALVGAGSNNLGGVNFMNSDTAAALVQAKSLAMEDARANAELYAEKEGLAVGQVLSIGTPGAAAPYRGNSGGYNNYAASAEASYLPPIHAGEQQVAASVQVIYEIAEVTESE